MMSLSHFAARAWALYTPMKEGPDEKHLAEAIEAAPMRDFDDLRRQAQTSAADADVKEQAASAYVGSSNRSSNALVSGIRADIRFPAAGFSSHARAHRLATAIAAAAACLLGSPPALAACSRPIVVPAFSFGKMIASDPATGSASGVYPEVLKTEGRRVGCTFVFPEASKARAEMMFRTGEADLLVGVVPVAERDRWGSYVPMVRVEWRLIATTRGALPTTSGGLQAMHHIRFNAVRGFNYGAEYSQLLGQLDAGGQLELVSRPEQIVKKMLKGRADLTFMPSHTFADTLDALGVSPAERARFRYARLTDLPATTAGAYLSKRLPCADAMTLLGLLQRIRKRNLVYERARELHPRRELMSLSPLKSATWTRSIAGPRRSQLRGAPQPCPQDH